MTHDDSTFALSVVSQDGLVLELEGQDGLTVDVPADTTQLQRVYVIAEPDSGAATRERSAFRFWVEDLNAEARTSNDSTFFGRDVQ